MTTVKEDEYIDKMVRRSSEWTMKESRGKEKTQRNIYLETLKENALRKKTNMKNVIKK